MRCIKCAAEITAWKCPQCGFDHTKAKVHFLSKPDPKELQIAVAASVPAAAVTRDGKFEIFDGKVLRKYHGAGEKVVVPSYVIHIAQGAFSGNQYCMSVELPDGLESIGSVAFDGCNNLETIQLPNGLKDIGIRAFSDCRKLKQIQIPGSVKFILPSAFSHCTSLESVVFQNGVKKLDTGIFSGCSKLKDIFVPDTVQEIEAARGGWLSQRIQIHASEKWIREHDAFFRQNSNYIPVQNKGSADALLNVLGEIEKKQVPSVNPYAAEFKIEGTVLLEYNGNREHVVIPAGITEIGKLAFSNNSTLRTVQLPASLRSLDTWAFDGCKNLESITFPPYLESIGTWAFDNCEKLTQVTLPSRLSELSSWAFSGCKNLKDVILQPGIRWLDLDAFLDCDNLQRILVPDSVEIIDIFFWEPKHSICIEGSSLWLQKHQDFFERNPNLIPTATDAPVK